MLIKDFLYQKLYENKNIKTMTFFKAQSHNPKL